MAGRPRGDRGERIAATAARLFRERGFHATTIDEIGRAEGISGGAIYRHFAGKDELLAAVARRGVTRIATCIDAVVDPTAPPDERLADAVRAGGRAVLEDLDAILVYMRDGALLSREQRRPIVAQQRANDDRLIDAIRGARPELSRQHAGFMLQSLAGMYLSVAHFATAVPRSRIEDIWTAMGSAALLGAPAVAVTVGRPRGAEPLIARAPASRREEILGAATALFRENGFGGVGVDDIGAAAGIAGPAVYRYFENKEDVLAAAMRRGGEQLAASVSAALGAPTVDDAIEHLLVSYVDIAIGHDSTIAVYLAEVDSLDERHRRAVRREQRGYTDEWAALVAQRRPDASADEVRVAVHATIGLANGYAQGVVRPPRDTSAAILVAMMRSALAAFTG